MIRPPVPNRETSFLENCKPQQLLGLFESCLKAGPKGNAYGLLPDAWGILFSDRYLSPAELVDGMRSGTNRLGEGDEQMLRRFIKEDCANGGKFVLDVIKKGGMIDRAALIMIADPVDLAGVEHDGTTALHLLAVACDKSVRPELIRRIGSRLLSGLFDRNGMPVLFSIFGLGDLGIHDLEAITEVFSHDGLRKVMAKNRMGKNALEILTEIFPSIKGKPARDRNAFSVTHAVKNTNMENVVRQQTSSPLQSESVAAPRVEAVPGKDTASETRTKTPVPGRSGPVMPRNQGRAPKIMIVDDDPIIRHLLQLRLKILGYDHPIPAGDGEEAVKLVLETRPDIVFMDISMPGTIDGITAAREIRKAQPDTRIVFISGYSDPALIERARDIHPDGYILKPFTETDLRVILELIR